ncbi:ATP-binding cassette, subfamily C, bacterial [Candidatus Magnetomoraceae bacterium gMMP-1]
MVCLSVLETVVLGAIAFFASAISDPEKVLKYTYIVLLRQWIHFDFLTNTRDFIIFISFLVVFLVVLKNIFQAWVNYWSIRYSAVIEGIFGEKLLRGFLNMPYEWHLLRNSADLILVVANWRAFIGRRTIYAFLQILTDILLVGFMLIALLVVQPFISLLVIIILGGASFFIFTSLRKILDKIAVKSRRYELNINQHATKAIHGFKDVKISGRQSVFLNYYKRDIYNFAKLQGIQQVATGSSVWILESVGFFMISASICIMLFFLDSSTARVSGTITLLAVTAWRVLPALNRILSKIASIRNGLPYVEQILKYCREIEANDIESYEFINNKIIFQNNIHIENVSFAYQNCDTFTLKNIELTFQKGTTVGIIGSSGAGKSTFVDIITGLLSPTEGRVLIDEQVLDNSLRVAWVRNIGYVSQSPYIFDGTIAENVAFGFDNSKIDRDRIQKCCSMAAMDDFIKELPKGIDTSIGERGVRMSGGQQQRVAIARALYQEPSVMIFDEATSSLDTRNEKAIQETIYSFKGKQTLIIIAHRLTTVESCDIIIQLEKGRIKKMGLPSEVLPNY